MNKELIMALDALEKENGTEFGTSGGVSCG